jgi:hypothetical protein
VSELIGLATLAVRINDHHRQALEHATTAVEHARRCGKLLLEAKAQVRLGLWLPWLHEHCKVSERTA